LQSFTCGGCLRPLRGLDSFYTKTRRYCLVSSFCCFQPLRKVDETAGWRGLSDPSERTNCLAQSLKIALLLVRSDQRSLASHAGGACASLSPSERVNAFSGFGRIHNNLFGNGKTVAYLDDLENTVPAPVSVAFGAVSDVSVRFRENPHGGSLSRTVRDRED